MIYVNVTTDDDELLGRFSVDVDDVFAGTVPSYGGMRTPRDANLAAIGRQIVEQLPGDPYEYLLKGGRLEYTDCGHAGPGGCQQCDACVDWGDREYHRRKEDP